MNITTKNDNPTREFNSINDELYRVYQFTDFTVKIDEPVALNISASRGHRVLDAQGVSHYIPSGWKHLYWKVKEGAQPFRF